MLVKLKSESFSKIYLDIYKLFFKDIYRYFLKPISFNAGLFKHVCSINQTSPKTIQNITSKKDRLKLKAIFYDIFDIS